MKSIICSAITTAMLITAFGQNSHISLDDYDFIAPDKWFVQKKADHILLSQSQNSAQEGCMIQILTPQPSSGDLEKDVKAVFDLMYPGWQYRFTGEKHDDLSKGHLVQGLEYCMMEAGMSKMSADGSRYDGFEDGAALVVKANNQIVIIAARHNRLLACECIQKYEKWRRFFNSFSLKNKVVPKPADEDVSKKILGSWMFVGSTVANEYIFAANGNYQFIGGYGTTSKTSDYNYDYIYTKSSAFKGDGSYSIVGNQLNFKNNKNKNLEEVWFRFEKVNHGGKGWNDRLWMLKKDATDGKKYEVSYERSEGGFK